MQGLSNTTVGNTLAARGCARRWVSRVRESCLMTTPFPWMGDGCKQASWAVEVAEKLCNH